MKRTFLSRVFTARLLGFAPSYQTLTSLVAGVLLLAFLNQSSADEIPGLYGTGVLDDGSPAPEDTLDLHYSLVGNTYGGPKPGVIVMSIPGRLFCWNTTREIGPTVH